MKNKIIALLGEAQAARVETKAAARGIQNIWKRAEDRARMELPGCEGPELADRAAIRAQQIAGVIPRLVEPEPAAAPVAPEASAPVEPKPEKKSK